MRRLKVKILQAKLLFCLYRIARLRAKLRLKQMQKDSFIENLSLTNQLSELRDRRDYLAAVLERLDR